MMMQENPNAFAKHDKSFRHMLLGAAHDALSKIGVLDPRTGNDAQSVISEAMLKNKDVRKTYDNFIKERTEHYRQRGQDIDTAANTHRDLARPVTKDLRSYSVGWE